MARYGRERESLSFVLAIVLHGLALLVVRMWGVPSPEAPPLTKPLARADEVEIDLSDMPVGGEVAQAAPAPPPGAPAGGPVASVAGDARRSSAGRRAAAAAVEPQPAPEVVASAELAPEPDA